MYWVTFVDVQAKKRAQLQSQEALLLLGVPESSVGDEVRESVCLCCCRAEVDECVLQTLQRAIAHKDRLLLFDKTSAQRSVVLDDQVRL